MRFRSFSNLFVVFWFALPATVLAQQAQPGQATSTESSATTAATALAQKPSTDPSIIEDGGFSIEPIYWLNRQQPELHGGESATAVGDFNYPGDANYSIGGQIGIPAGPQNTLRFSYFRVQGNSTATLTQDQTYFSEAYNTGDYLEGGYRLEDFKVSWDYLSYNWEKKSGKLRLKTLYELQYITISTNFNAPFKPVTTDSSGNTDYNTATGSKNMIWPSFGLELEQRLSRHLRWEGKASGFGFPHHAALWDAEGAIGYRAHDFELLLGGRAFHFKTSPQSDAYFIDTLAGAYVGVRYYWGTTKW